jgi:hypothetical protein
MKLIDVKKIPVTLWIILVVCSYPCIFMWAQNIAEEGLKTLLFPLGFFLFLAFICECILLIIFKDMYKAVLIDALFMIIFMNYRLIEKVIIKCKLPVNDLSFGIVMLILIAGLCVFLKITKKEIDTPCIIVGLTFSVLILINFVGAIPKIIDMKQNVSDVEVEQYAKDKSFKENVYYFVFDEYGGKENLKYYFNYDNTEFLNELRSKGFAVSDNSYNRESVYTYDIIPNLFNYSYVTSTSNTSTKNRRFLKNPVMYRFFKDLGYDINVISHQRYLDTKDCNVLFESSKDTITDNEKNVGDYILENSFVVVILNVLTKNNTKNNSGGMSWLAKEFVEKYASEIDESFDICDEIWKYSDKKPTLTVAYMSSPHRPCVLDEDGNVVDNTLVYRYKESYIGYLKYVNKRITKMIDGIIENDPNAIIIFQADHGTRIPLFSMGEYDKNKYDEKLESEMMENVFNCVYFGNKEPQSIEGLSCVNTIRTVLNYLYGTDYKMIEPKEKYIYKWKYDLSDDK